MAEKKTKKPKKAPVSKQPKKQEEPKSNKIKVRLIALFLLFIFFISICQLGIVGGFFHTLMVYIFGSMMIYPILIILSIISAYFVIKGEAPQWKGPQAIGLVMMIIGILLICTYAGNMHSTGSMNNYIKHDGVTSGGLIGSLLYAPLSALFSPIGTLIFGIILLLAGLVLFSSKYIHQYRIKQNEKEAQDAVEVFENKKKTSKVKDFFAPKQKEKGFFPDKVFEEKEPLKEPDIDLTFNQKSMRLDIEKKKPKKMEYKDGVYQLPSFDILNPIRNTGTLSEEAKHAKNTGKILENMFEEFGVNANVVNLYIGPTVTKFEIKLEAGTRVNRILQLQDDIQLALAAKEIRIEAPIPGKPYVGIEVPNKTAAMVPFNEVYQLSMRDDTWDNKLAVPLGKDVSGNLIVAELNKMPHLLIAGATGSGKSVCVNSIITSILMKATPDEVRLILVDPKKVELSNYNGVPHLLSPVVTDPKKAAGVLQQVVAEMERRYEVFAENGQRNMESFNIYARTFNEKANDEDKKEIMPYHVVILDEVADLMMVASKTVEDCIMRISQMARAAGIHLIVATQRPSTDIITGVIKANIPSRIAFAVSSSVDSRTILDATGAEKLLGKGDMLFSPMGSSSPVRVQGAFVADEEVSRVVEFVSKQMDANYDDNYVNAKEVSNGGSSVNDSLDDTEEEYEECREFVIKEQRASTSLLQRRFRIGYNKAARIMDQLEQNGVIGPQIGSKPREVYIRGYSEEDI